MMYAILGGGHFLLTQRWQMGIGQHGYAKFGWFARICGHICKRISSGKSTFDVMIWSQLKLKSNSPYLIWLPYMGWVAEGSSPMAWNAARSEVLCLSSVTASVRAEFLLWYLSQSQSVTPAVCKVEVSCLFSLPMAVSALCHAGMESKNGSKWSDISKCHPRSERRVGWCWLLRWFGAARWEEHMWRVWSLSLRSFAASDGIYTLLTFQ